MFRVMIKAIAKMLCKWAGITYLLECGATDCKYNGARQCKKSCLYVSMIPINSLHKATCFNYDTTKQEKRLQGSNYGLEE